MLRYGPPGFETYLRLPVDPDGPVDPSPIADTYPMMTALRVLASHTSTPDDAYVAVWHGYNCGPMPTATPVPLPRSPMFLFGGPVSAMRYAPQVVRAEPGTERDTGLDMTPDLVWPADHAWCLACEVDEEIELSIGCSTAAAEALRRALPGLVRRVDYGEDAPSERVRR